MARKNDSKKKTETNSAKDRNKNPLDQLHPDTKKSIWSIVFIGLSVILILAGPGVEKAGPVGGWINTALVTLLGWGYFMVPLALFLIAAVLLTSDRQKLIGITTLGGAIMVISALGIIHIYSPGNGGWFGYVLGGLKLAFGDIAATLINVIILIISVLMIVNIPVKFRRKIKEEIDEVEAIVTGVEPKPKKEESKEKETKEEDIKPIIAEPKKSAPIDKSKKLAVANFKNYVPPPLDLLKSTIEKPTTGDLRGNANIIKRTLESFGIAVEMGEINIGPKVTRYTLKPAEGVKLARITALNQDLALALAAHPIRIEAPIPGKSLVGIEVPNKAAATVRLGSLIGFEEFQAAGPLAFVLGRDVTGESMFANIDKMPHMLIAGATGSGKSVMIHSLLISLLYKNSPSSLRFLMIDPKRVELTIYENIPHLISNVVTEPKKAVGVFKWAISEMDRRYELLQAAGSRDIKSYNSNAGKETPMPYIVIVVDELADLMATYGREIEGSIVRLAQMARAVGIHLILSTQRPSVEVITGLIKANITSRIALQVASQIDSRTILDTAGAEKLLGGGDLLFISSDFSKPKRIQGAYISEDEINKVANFIRDNNDISAADVIPASFEKKETANMDPNFDEFAGGNGDDDDLYDDAVRIVGQAQKASASLLQRRLKVGYARAARLLDLMEEKGIIGPGEGAKPREVYLEKIPQEEF